MKKFCVCLLLFLLFLPHGASAEAETAEWTVMFYFCGGDLESRYGFASREIDDIVKCGYYNACFQEEWDKSDVPRINVVVETGGSKAWQNWEGGPLVNAKALQRWSYRPQPGQYMTDFTLEQELPLQNMTAPQTLADFIRWGVSVCPARKYALVLWGHGNGAKTGLLLDEWFPGDALHLDELRQALADGGIFFEAVVLDACLMANVETACALSDSAAWMIASEEMVPGEGTAAYFWLQELFNRPEQDGRQLGRVICDMTQQNYARGDNVQGQEILTWSVVDLSKVQRVAEAAERFLEEVCLAYSKRPFDLQNYAQYMLGVAEYGDAQQNMRDLSSVFYSSNAAITLNPALRGEMISALEDAVVYCVRGSSRTGSRGLSFCFPADFSNEELDLYARNCTSPRYLAFLDAITPWTAPDWVYDAVERLPEISTLADYRITVEKRMSAQGMPGLVIKGMYPYANVNYCLYRLDEKTKQTVRLGRTMCRAYFPDGDTTLWSAVEPWWWPTIDGELCSIELIAASDTEALYNVPIQVGSDIWYLRYKRNYERYIYDLEETSQTPHLSQYTVYGLWEGYDDELAMMSRNNRSLSQLAGQEYSMLYPVTGKNKYILSKFHSLYRAMQVETAMLPAGTYYLQYEVEDMFLRPIQMERIEMRWDGKTLSFPQDFAWQGTETLEWTGD